MPMVCYIDANLPLLYSYSVVAYQMNLEQVPVVVTASLNGKELQKKARKER